MSSPIVEKEKGLIEKSLINIHQRASHNNRVNILSKLLGDRIDSLFENKKETRCIDIGCGDMTIAENIAIVNTKTNWTCIDIHKLPEELKDSEKWKKYKQFDGTTIPFENNSFDCALFCDVLHHISHDLTPLITEAARVASVVIIKDHFEYGFYSRNMLKLMDFVGNWGYGVSIPEYYFTQKNFELLCSQSGLKIAEITVGIDLYSHLPFVRNVLSPNWQFISVLKQQ